MSKKIGPRWRGYVYCFSWNIMLIEIIQIIAIVRSMRILYLHLSRMLMQYRIMFLLSVICNKFLPKCFFPK